MKCSLKLLKFCFHFDHKEIPAVSGICPYKRNLNIVSQVIIHWGGGPGRNAAEFCSV